MAIQRIEEVHFGVEDVAECVRFFDDFGLAKVEAGSTGATFRTPAGQHLYLRRADDPDLGPALESGSTLRRLVWGVSEVAALDALADDLARDREVVEDAEGRVLTVDETGYGLGFRVVAPTGFIPRNRGSNATGAIGRWNEPLTTYDRAHPLRFCHVALNIPLEGREAAVAFYVDRLGFRITDQLLDMGTFLQAPGDDDQHTFLLAHRPDRAGINHVAYEVRNFDEVIEGGNFMVKAGWKEARRLGRHTIGSNVFRFFHAPCGGRVEYAADMDRVDDSYGPNVYTERPPHHMWMLTSQRDQETA